MFLKLLWFTNLLAHALSSTLKDSVNLIERHTTNSATPTTTMISRLINESRRSTLLFIHLNSEILDNFVRFHNAQVTMEVNNLNEDSKLRERKFDATILHLDSYIEFENFFPLIRRQNFLYDGHFVILYDGADEELIEKMFSQFWDVYIYNVNVLMVNGGTSNGLVSMFTYMPFASDSCGDAKPIRINEFNKTTTNWTTNEFFPEKFNKLNGCPLRYISYDNRGRFIIDHRKSGVERYSGIDVDILDIFSNAINATLNVSDYNPPMESPFQKISDNEVDSYAAVLLNERAEILDPSEMVYTDTLVLVVPPPYLIAPMKKILLPFTTVSWMAIGMVAFLSFCVIKILKVTPRILHDYVIGSNVKGSMLNVWNIFLGGSQLILPRSNFPRYLLALFLIFSLITRTVYQGKVFDIMKRDVRTVELKTIDAFIEHEFTFYIYEFIVERLQGSRVMQRHEVIKDTDRMLYNMKTIDSSFKGVVLNYLNAVLYEMKQNNISLTICREVVYTSSFVFYFRKNYYLIDKFNEFVEILQSAGLIDFIHSKYIDDTLVMRTGQRQAALALTYGQIEGFFTVFCVGCALAFASFICEIIHFCACVNRMVGK